MSELAFSLISSPVGELLALADEGGLRGLHMQAGPGARSIDPRWRHDHGRFAGLERQLDEYFSGVRSAFGPELDLAPGGTVWQERVWRAVLGIPYGETVAYGALAGRLGRPRSARAVGLANARNPISIVIPCHRLVGADGALTGYAGGVERKRTLLELENRSAVSPMIRRDGSRVASLP